MHILKCNKKKNRLLAFLLWYVISYKCMKLNKRAMRKHESFWFGCMVYTRFLDGTNVYVCVCTRYDRKDCTANNRSHPIGQKRSRPRDAPVTSADGLRSYAADRYKICWSALTKIRKRFSPERNNIIYATKTISLCVCVR